MKKSEQVGWLVGKRIAELEHLTDQSSQKALLAELRRGVGRQPGEIPQLWGVLFRNVPEDMMSRTGEPTAAEWAIYTALTLYALHQQGRDPEQKSMNCPGQGIGCAVAMLVKNEDEDLNRVRNRFNRFALSVDMPQAVTHLRGIISMLKANGIGLDYAKLAEELYNAQFYESAKRVRLKWGQDFYRYLNRNHNDDNDKDEEDTENE